MTDEQIAMRAVDRELIARLLFEVTYTKANYYAPWRGRQSREHWKMKAQDFINKLLDSGEQPSNAGQTADE